MPTPSTTDDLGINADRIGLGDPRYLAVVEKRFTASPD
jgi:hypothetical protein